MKNLGTINGKVEILVDEFGSRRVTLVAPGNVISLEPAEVRDLSDVMNVAAWGCNPENLPKFGENFQPKKD